MPSLWHSPCRARHSPFVGLRFLWRLCCFCGGSILTLSELSTDGVTTVKNVAARRHIKRDQALRSGIRCSEASDDTRLFEHVVTHAARSNVSMTCCFLLCARYSPCVPFARVHLLEQAAHSMTVVQLSCQSHSRLVDSWGHSFPVS